MVQENAAHAQTNTAKCEHLKKKKKTHRGCALIKRDAIFKSIFHLALIKCSRPVQLPVCWTRNVVVIVIVEIEHQPEGKLNHQSQMC